MKTSSFIRLALLMVYSMSNIANAADCMPWTPERAWFDAQLFHLEPGEVKSYCVSLPNGYSSLQFQVTKPSDPDNGKTGGWFRNKNFDMKVKDLTLNMDGRHYSNTISDFYGSADPYSCIVEVTISLDTRAQSGADGEIRKFGSW